MGISCLMACEKTVELDLPTEKPRLVMHAYLNPDSTLKVELTKSAYILDPVDERRNVEGVSVEVFEEDKSLGTMQSRGNGWYELEGTKPVEGKHYRIEAHKAGMEKITATEKVLPRKEMLELKIDTLGKSSSGHYQLEISFYIDDKKGEHFYLVSADHVVNYTGTNPYDGSRVEHSSRFGYSLDESELSTESLCYSACITVLKDVFFEGKRHQVRLRGWTDVPQPPEGYEIVREMLSIKLQQVSMSFYLYQLNLHIFRESSYDPFAEPTQLYSNVEEGYGILGAVSTTLYEIELQ